LNLSFGAGISNLVDAIVYANMDRREIATKKFPRARFTRNQ
jgi:hypothetical protein